MANIAQLIDTDLDDDFDFDELTEQHVKPDEELTLQFLDTRNVTGLTNGFFADLTDAVIKTISDTTENHFFKNKEAMKYIPECIKKHTGMTCFIDDRESCFAMIPPDINKNHPLIRNGSKVWFENKDIAKAGGKLDGRVDLKNWRVEGDFATKVPISLFLDVYLMHRSKLSYQEIAAVIIHEVGHMFSYFALVDKMFRINMPMLATVYHVAQAKEPEKRRIILESWTKTNLGGKSTIDPDELSKQSNDVVTTMVVQDTEMRLRSASGSGEYDEVNSEWIADNYASRMGCGRFVVTALDTIYKEYAPTKEMMSRTSFIISEIMKIFQFFMGFVMVALMPLALITLQLHVFVLLLITSLNWIIGVPLFSSNAGDGVYDNIIRRYQRIRLDLLSMLKDKKLGKVLAKQISDDIEVIDQVLKGYTERTSWIGAVVDVLLPSKRKLKTQTQIMAELEDLSSNNLFRHASDLRNL